MSADRSDSRRRARLCAGVTLGALAALGASTAVGPAAEAAAATPHASGASAAVIVVLRNQHPDLPAVAAAGRRAQAVGADQGLVRARIGRLGGRTTHAYRTLNAVAATLPASAVTALAADPTVAAVVPDLPRHLAAQPADSPAAGTGAPNPPPGACPSDPAHPLLEPEALQRTHTASEDPAAPTARSLGYDGSGVKVGFIADGVDVEQPDFIRADGSRVIVDYQDFSGDGTAAPTSGAEALGDGSSIAAQGRQSYDLADYVNPAHPLPKGCTIRVEGMAPGASLVALKVFSNALLTAPTSTIIQAIDYAVNVAHVNVLNESFGSNPYPDNATDPISALNHQAVDAGVTVVASTGDAGIGNTQGTAATDPFVISAGASTTFRSYAQRTAYGFQLSNGRWASDQVSALSSGGISQTNRVQDLLAPGDLGWALCSSRLGPDGSPLYTGCTDDKGDPADIQDFGGTSQSAPFTAGAAALVVQAYRAGHAGASPTPQQVRRALDSTADDLGLPAEEQGAGLLDTYRAVQLARSLDGGAPTGQQLAVDTTQLDSVARAGASVTGLVKVINTGTAAQHVNATLRRVDTLVADTTQTVQLDRGDPATPTFVDSFGITRAYRLATFTVPAGTDRLVASVSIPGPAGKIVRLSLLDPQGTYTAYTLPQGVGDFGQVDVHQPRPGTWTAIVWTGASRAGYSGPVALRTRDFAASSAGIVAPAAFTLAPGASRTVVVITRAPQSEAVASSLVLTGAGGQTTTVPVVTRAVQQVHRGRPTTFSGTFEAANGRSYAPGQTDTYLFDVPSGARDLTVDLRLSGLPANSVVAHLSDPTGEPIATDRNERPVGDASVTDTGLQVVHAEPITGRWQLTLELLNPVAGAALPQTFTGAVSLDAVQVHTSGVPTGGTVSSRGTTATVTLTNTSPQPRTYFVDPRSATLVDYRLVAKQDATTTDPFAASVALPLPSEDVPAWLVPTQAQRLTVTSSATAPTEFDVMPLDNPTALNAPNNPDVEAVRSGTSATAVHTAPEVASALWAAFPSLVGPFPAGGAAPGQVSMQATVRAKAFAAGWTSSTGDPLLATVDPAAPAATPVTVAPGQQVTLTLQVRPTGAKGQVDKGTIYVDVLNPYGAQGTSGYVDELAALPYSYRVGS